ncbi:hypothetical protein JX266_014278 [Neoarthrinium moseri]|nr:hypothetical protein JX266_014278 [Neoarthrinium moseri]
MRLVGHGLIDIALRVHLAFITLDSHQLEDVQLPFTAVKCVIGQYLEVFHDSSWACLVVGSFYDNQDDELWHIEVFISWKAGATQSETDSEFGQQRLIHTTPHSFGDPVIGHQFLHQSPFAFPVLSRGIPFFPARASYSPGMSNIGHGWNPTTGWDTGHLPPGTGHATGPAGYSLPSQPSFVSGGLPDMTYASPGGSYHFTAHLPGPPGSIGPVYTMPQNGYQHPVPVISDQPGGPRWPMAHPVVSPECPAINLQNSTGGVGCEPGYNYYFPADHTKVHVIKSREPPWRLAAGMDLQFVAFHVPCNTTLGDLMKGFGATNSVTKKNKITEVTEGGNNRWYKGVTFCADDADDMKKTLKDLGWDKSRTGRHGERPVVWLWVTKD